MLIAQQRDRANHSEVNFNRTKIVAQIGSVKFPSHNDAPCDCDEIRNDLITYRGIDFKTKDLIDMRSVIH